MSLLSHKDISIAVEGLDHPEGVAWGLDNTLYAGGEAGQIYRINLGSGFSEVATTGGSLLGICLDGRNNVYACDIKHRAVMRVTPDGEVSVYSNGSADRKMAAPNYPVFDQAGNLYVSDSGGWHENNGCVFQIAPDGTTSVLSTQASAFPNGMALSPNGDSLYVVLSNIPSVAKLEFAEDGTVGDPIEVVKLPRTVPDGLAFDRQGDLYISCYVPDLIYRLSTGGELIELVRDDERTLIASPTNVAFFGDDLQMLAAANYGGWHLVQAKMPTPGCPLHYPVLP